MMNLLETLNRAWFLSLNAQPGAPGWLMTFATVCAQYLLYVIPVILLAYWFLGGKAGHRTALFTLATVLAALGLGFICSVLYFHPRPFMIPLGHSWIFHAPETSFPSDHATLFFSTAFSLLVSRAFITGTLVLVLSLLVAWSRVFLGVHFPLDMAGAATVAALACVLVKPAWFWWSDALTALCEAVSGRLFSWLPARFTP